MNVTELVGERCLLKLSGGSAFGYAVDEYKVLEVSPSGNWIKLMNMNGRKFWRSVVDISFVEVLANLKADKPK